MKRKEHSARRDIVTPEDRARLDAVAAIPKPTVRLRLVVALPVLMALLTLVSGHAAKVLFDHWTQPGASATRAADLAFAQSYVYGVIHLAPLLAAVGGIFITWVILAPLRRITRQVEELASGGVGHSFQVQSGDEIESLGKSLNRMIQNMTRYLPERARFIFHNMASGILTFNDQGVLTSINSAADKMLELDGVGINGRHFGEFFSQFGDLQPLVDLMEETRRTGRPATCREIRVRLRSGSALTLGVSVTRIQEPGSPHFEVLATLMDLTSVREVSNRMVQSDKLSAVGSLAAGVAHEIRNPLATLRGFSQLLLESETCQGTEREYLEMIKSETDRLSNVVNRLLDFARPARDERASCNGNALLLRARELARHAIGKACIRVEEDLDPDLPLIHADEKRLLQACLNLLLNAVEATGPNGTVRIASRGTAGGGEIRLEVANTGSHIPEDQREVIFHPFYTTKERGTGLGLAITGQIIEEHGGRIWVEEPRPMETVFLVALPVARDASVTAPRILEGTATA